MSAIVLLLSLGTRGHALDPVHASADLHLGNLRVAKILFLGNSITLHGPAEQIGWSGNWGMAASAAEKDYVHLLVARVKNATRGEPQVMVRNLADFERQYATYDLGAGLKEALDFQADVIIIALGENVPALSTSEAQTAYRLAFVKLLKTLRQRGRPAIFVRSTFWAEPIRNQLMAQACQESGDVFIELKDLDKDEGNFARAERKFEHAGVAAHPGDKGMQAIADGIWQAIETTIVGCELAGVPWTDGGRTCRFARSAAHLERDRERRLEDSHPRPRLVVARDLAEPDMGHDRHRGRHTTVRRLRGSRQWSRSCTT